VIKALKIHATKKQTILTIITVTIILLAWSIIGSLIHTQNTNQIVSDYLLQTQSMIAQFYNSTTPSNLKDIQNPTCIQPTTMNFVAHEDDDLLFMNPAILHDIQIGNCVRTVYFTAGDNGHDSTYWLSRQRGAEQAYGSMLGSTSELWQERLIKLPTGQIATIANLHGNGFARTDHQSLQKLYTSQIAELKTVDATASYTSLQLTQTLASLMQTFRPTSLRSLSSSVNIHTPDHSDHTNVARYTTLAYEAYLKQTPELTPAPTITYYLGYPIRDLPATLNQTDVAAKTKAFLAYGAFDNAMCHKITLCYTHAIYGSYLQRQYTSPY
jgi:LmbE family N-acetylglucosaminyl deacetylase